MSRLVAEHRVQAAVLCVMTSQLLRDSFSSLPQSHLECRLWNDIFVDAQKELGIPNGALVLPHGWRLHR